MNEIEILNKQIKISKDGFNALKKVTNFCCCGCGLCVSTCPQKLISFDNKTKRPKLNGKCNNCGACYLCCPRSFLPISKIEKKFFGECSSEIEERVGKFHRLFAAKSIDNKIWTNGTPGGTTTGIVHYLIKVNDQ